ncbi:hypothetical protein GCM10007320_08750 [Pseudorhodoferax aquiterrae]|uniref:Phage protein n=1 Tax=Pseudorhodoferax aquiterrae TaxID=747304 RepID=A0ABQ3FWE0_9BURK|nr:Gp49 family protein [Pseudorhodoferax aquiterrae]GHC72700.1 hypothetical protein GCM10007320_08750 [Pseudorhodoferax aquiterrae]
MKSEITIKFTVDATEPKAREAAIDWALRSLRGSAFEAFETPGSKPFRGHVAGDTQDAKVATYEGEIEVRDLDAEAIRQAAGVPLENLGRPVAEADIVAAGAAVAPRVNEERLASVIASEHYFTAWEGAQLAYWGDSDPANPKPAEGQPDKDGPLGLLTFCVLVLRNGFTVTGESACASPENFNAEIGRRIARENAVAKIWPLEGYLLRQRLHEGAKS